MEITSHSCLYSCSRQRMFLVIVSVPLLDKFNNFEIFDIFSMPAPMKNSKVPDDNLPNMVAWYNLVANSNAVNSNQMKYALLSKK